MARLAGDADAVATPGVAQDAWFLNVFGLRKPATVDEAVAKIIKYDEPYGAVVIDQGPDVARHVVGFINQGGNVIFVDPQMGKIVTLKPTLKVEVGTPP
ncbi:MULTISPECIES: hypothetical protein [Rhizobium]|uniref:Tox-PL domain-containing protein n=1 Tax=Rhizobium paranaense TaxID=1650438 RepID=A0A7W8XT21_9HYPH|nr:hypothetical protein [Rhizobium paranaense]MBB5574991.1 hypothetical protein [Rhizobium paranaense]